MTPTSFFHYCLVDPPRNGNYLIEKIVMGSLEHLRNDTGGKVCNNNVQQEDAAGAADSKLFNRANGTVEPMCCVLDSFMRRTYLGQWGQ